MDQNTSRIAKLTRKGRVVGRGTNKKRGEKFREARGR